MKILLFLHIAILLSLLPPNRTVASVESGAEQKSDVSILDNKVWIHGSEDCKSNPDPKIEVLRFDKSTYILRQNKCVSFEAPFIYVLFGSKTALILETGATKSAAEFPLQETVKSLLEEQKQLDGVENREILILHSHSHRDHSAADVQFAGVPNVTIIYPNKKSVTQFFGFDHWPKGEAHIDLGSRRLTIIPTPGHQEEGITIYDAQTKWLLTGDTLYPGLIFVKNWDDYKASISRLMEFASQNEIGAILGAHIEMKREAGVHYSIGATYQPNERGLRLNSTHLEKLHKVLQKCEKPSEIIFDDFVIKPMGKLQKMISSILKFIF